MKTFLFSLLAIFAFAQTPATKSIQDQIDSLVAERAQLQALQRECAVAPRNASRDAIQAVIDKLTALKADARATPDIDALFDIIIARFQERLKDFDEVTRDAPCTLALGAAARIGVINSQLPKLEALKNQ